jgi:hypothetical protein
MLAGMPNADEVPAPVREGRDLLDSFYGFSREDDPDRYVAQDVYTDETLEAVRPA